VLFKDNLCTCDDTKEIFKGFNFFGIPKSVEFRGVNNDGDADLTKPIAFSSKVFITVDSESMDFMSFTTARLRCLLHI
jgi:hypothetical protein